MAKLSKRTVDTARTSGADIFMWDDEVSGFGLRVKKSGAKSFLVQYRNAQGRSRRLTLGKYGVLTVEEVGQPLPQGLDGAANSAPHVASLMLATGGRASGRLTIE